MKYCTKCGAQNSDNAKFCTECGAVLIVSESLENSKPDTNYTYAEVSDNDTVSDTSVDPVYSYGTDGESYTGSSSHSSTSNDKYTYTYDAHNQTNYTSVHPGITQRNIVVAIILSIVTCGIYQIYWMIKMNDEVNELAGETAATSGVLVFLLTLITCGIYGIYWSYKMGERCDRIKGSVGGSSNILYLILTLLGFGIVTYCLIQDTINKTI